VGNWGWGMRAKTRKILDEALPSPNSRALLVRDDLAKWAHWWGRVESRGLDYSSLSPSARLMDLARVGCHIQATKRAGTSEEIRVPEYIGRTGAAVESLPEALRVAVMCFYVRRGRVRPRRTLTLLRAEDEVAVILYGPETEVF